MNSVNNKKITILTYSIYIIIIDQISKILILNKVGMNSTKNIIPGLLNITLVKNKGAAFSMFSNLTTLLTIISFLASLIILTVILKFPPRSYWNSMGLGFLLGGTIGNGIDRFFKGYVLDFFELVPINFPIFNIADVSINIAIIFFLLDIIRTKKHHYLNKIN